MKTLIATLLVIYAPIGLSQNSLYQDSLNDTHAVKTRSVAKAPVPENDREVEDDPGILKDAQTGDPLAQNAYGMIQYQKGNYQEAAKWWLKAANRGHQNAQLSLGKMYEKGIGVEMDYPKAYFLYSISAAQGNQEAAKAKAKLDKKLTPGHRIESKKYYKQYNP